MTWRSVRLWLSEAVTVAMLLTLAACNDGSPPPPTVSASVTGTVSYEDRLYGAHGFTGDTAYKTLRYAMVDLVDYKGAVIATTATDANGNYSLQGKGGGLYVRVLAQTTATAGAAISINSPAGDTFAITQALQSGDAGDVTLDIPVSLNNRIAGVFNMLDVYTNAALFVTSLSTHPLPEMKVYWQAAASNYGTYFCPSAYRGGSCPQGKGIYIVGGNSSGGDTDEYDDDVLMHEYGHYLETTLGIRDSPGGTHFLTDNDEDLRLSWSEGWGGFFPDALKSWLKAQDPERLSSVASLPVSYYVDTYGSVAGISINMAAPDAWLCPGGSDCFDYSTNEVSVAKVLSGLRQAFGMQAIWDVMSGYMAHGTSLPASLETLWDGWLQQCAPGAADLQQLQTIFGERQIFYREDAYESDDTIASARVLAVCAAAPCTTEQHYLYRSNFTGDADLFSVTLDAGTAYEIETLGLSNGADTYLRLLDQNGNVVVNGSGQGQTDDNRPGTTFCYPYDNPCRIHYDDTMLSSSLDFTPSQSGTYYVEVKTSPAHPAGAGRYGSYSILARQL